MGVRHSPTQRKRWALQAEKYGVDAVAAQARVKPGTVRNWCTEFGVSTGTRGSSPAVATPLREADRLGTASVAISDLAGSEPVDDLDDLVEKASDELSRELSSWLADTKGRELASERLGEVISDWEAEHGEFTDQELEAARTELFG